MAAVPERDGSAVAIEKKNLEASCSSGCLFQTDKEGTHGPLNAPSGIRHVPYLWFPVSGTVQPVQARH